MSKVPLPLPSTLLFRRTVYAAPLRKSSMYSSLALRFFVVDRLTVSKVHSVVASHKRWSAASVLEDAPQVEVEGGPEADVEEGDEEEEEDEEEMAGRLVVRKKV